MPDADKSPTSLAVFPRDTTPQMEVKTTRLKGRLAGKISFACYERLGTEVHLVPEGQEPTKDMVEKGINILTSEDALHEGMRLLVPSLFGWSLGIMTLDEKGNLTCGSPSGNMGYALKFDTEYEPGPARWICIGSANLKGLSKLNITTGPAKEQPDEK